MMNKSDDVRSSLMQKLRYYIHRRVCVLEEYYTSPLFFVNVYEYKTYDMYQIEYLDYMKRVND